MEVILKMYQAQTWPDSFHACCSLEVVCVLTVFLFLSLLADVFVHVLWQWFVAAAAPELITADCDRPSNPLWGTVRRAFRL